MIQFQAKNTELIKDILFNTNPEHLRTYLEIGLTKSNLFEWKFVHVAKRFGAITRDAEYGKVRMKKIIEDYVGTPIYKETLKELEVEKLDIEKAIDALKKIQNKEIKVIFKSGLSPLGKLGSKYKFGELVGPEKPEKEIFELFKKRLLSTQVKLICFNCGNWDQTFTVKEIPEKVKCGKCGAKLLGIVKSRNPEIVKLVKKKLRNLETTALESKFFERIKRTVDLFLVYGKKACVCLAGRGIGPDTTIRILARYHKNDEELFRDILEAERQYIKTKKYWKI